MKGKKNTKWELGYLIFLLIIFILGIIHTAFSAYSLYSCNGCSAPYSLAFIFPGLLYLIVLCILAIIYYFIRKKYIFAVGLLICLLGLIALIVLKLLGLL